ncbi:hypothetical protein PPL_05479 [Heterostelium album PN500]|uniref:Uncharacterized protein n=1 Tax=Heterostelium pallidum (strain ATCC 26659 / Pp 5 / PN500) TaxID=670386 RepID=D3BAA4_HETP5|nr:hypothetical protein PPL_05479 [Heterostelium album PN500]EFA81491.1 hypothetical protein PPL_05479 [Heterostelium album PN500]|eukprot:XP_020433609.1 hypothetical protein PPL_05479 [Heterostelium album PN500]
MNRNIIQLFNNTLKSGCFTVRSSPSINSGAFLLQQQQQPATFYRLPEAATFEQSMETVMNKTSRKMLKRHRKKVNGTKSNMRRL